MDNKNMELYLSEDQDLLGEIETIGPPSSGMVEEQKMHKLTILQIKAALRNRKTAHELDKSTRKYSLVLIAFALVQVIIGIYQFLFEVEFSSHWAVGILYVVAVLVLGVFIFRELAKDIEKF
ncbi:MAG TPA: hypothetical protein VMA75_03340 [Candidatus Paceibacterota bacterium]|nr:hypothetical protein [Candidatus Paceibacterota bacterium]